MSENEEEKPRATAKERATRKTTSARKQSAPRTTRTSKTKEPTPSKPVISLKDLRIGARSSDSVRELQRKLGVDDTGNFDGVTQAAVRAWQNTNGFSGGRGIQVSGAQAARLFGNDYVISD